MSDARDCCKCSFLNKEVVALELLVRRYQLELTASKSCSVCGRRAHESLPTVEEELFETQRLDAVQWNSVESAVPLFTTRNGQPCTFDQIALPSTEWSWTSDWYLNVSRQTDANGWIYAASLEELATGRNCHSDRLIDHRARRRRWKRARKFIGSTDLPQTVSLTLEHEAHLSALQHANKKLTEQLRRANDRILDYEDKLQAYEAKLTEMQKMQPLARPSRIHTSLVHESSLTSATPFSPSKSRDVLYQSEALLNQILTTPSTVFDEHLWEAQHIRSQMVKECQQELDGAVSEFQTLVQTLDDPRKASQGA